MFFCLMFLILRLPDMLWMGWDTVSEFGFTNSSFTDVFFATHTHTHTHTNTHTYIVNKQSYLIKSLKLNRQLTFEHRFQQGKPEPNFKITSRKLFTNLSSQVRNQSEFSSDEF